MEETYRARYGGRGRVPSPSATLQICMRSPSSSPKAFQTPLENFCYHVSQYIQEKPGNGVSLPLALAQHIRRPRWRGVWTCSDVVPPQKPRSALPVPPAGGGPAPPWTAFSVYHSSLQLPSTHRHLTLQNLITVVMGDFVDLSTSDANSGVLIRG